jgi:hypothetical protein
MRRASLAAALCAGAWATSAAMPGPAGADTASQGSSYSQLMEITPHDGSLAVGAVFGESLAGHTNSFARAQSQGVDLGAVGDSMQGYNCGPPNPTVVSAVPQPLETETGQQGASDGVTQGPSQSDYGANEFVKADGTPYGEADTTYAGPVSAPGDVFTVSGMHSKSWSGVVGSVSEAGATVDIGELDLGGGAVVLHGLHWESVDPFGSGTKPSSFFTVGHVVIAGNTLPYTPDLTAVQAAINQALAPLGIQVSLPAPFSQQGTQFVPALAVNVVPDPARDGVTDQVVQGFEGQNGPYYPIANGLENGFGADPSPYSNLGALENNQAGQQIAAALCHSDTAFTVADVTVASFDGGGHFTASLGGVQASTSAVPPPQYDLSALGFGSLTSPGSDTFVPGTDGSLASLAAGGGAGGGGAGAPAGSLALGRRAGGVLHEVAAGSLLWAVIGGLVLMGALVEGDRRMMRRAQRLTVPASDRGSTTGGTTT